MNPIQDAFISYGRADSKQFVRKLSDRLLESGIEVWVDFEDIPLGVDYQKQIDDAIDKADNFIFVIAPHSINSAYCLLEVERALKHNKRIIPLLHVEQISYDTWKERNPEGTAADWDTFRSAGKHSSFPNMHPAISKINWVYCREGIDDFDQSFQGLLDIFQRSRDYVRQHTTLLSQALTWERNQRQIQYLLAGESLQQAEAWLKTRFREVQSPCWPTDLQCEFITESIKNANNYMTQAFLSHAEEDAAIAREVHLSLRRMGFTTWTSWSDIRTGVDFQAAIDLGIEAADNLIYLLSPASLRSHYCQYELNYALRLNKRIIPLLVRPVDLETVPEPLRVLQFIDLSDNTQPSDYWSDESDLIRALNREATYYDTHKRLLVQALKWQRQRQNPSILLRGYELRQAESWLTVAKQHPQHPPVSIQTDFIETSRQQPLDITIDVFISCSEKDLDFARRLNDTLQVQGESTWFEQSKWADNQEYRAQVRQGIENAENFILIVSPSSLTSTSCLEELDWAQTLCKRIVAVSYQPLAQLQIPTALAASLWVDFTAHDGDFLTNFGELYRMLKSNPEYVQAHTRLLVKALEWEQSGHDDSLLLRSRELTNASTWLQQAAQQTPPPTDRHRTYIQASQALPFRRIKLRSAALMGAMATVFVLAARLLGVLQGAELQAYDHLLRRQPNEAPDDRFLIVTVDENSGSLLRERLIAGDYAPTIGTIPDAALQETLRILAEHQPRLIGLDFYRDFPATPELANSLRSRDTIITLCKASYEGEGVPKSPEVPWERVGFSDLVSDTMTGPTYIRRHYIMQAPDPDFCNTPRSFSLLLASRYLKQEAAISRTDPLLPVGNTYEFRRDGLAFGETVISNLTLGRGPYYQDPDFFNGYQTLLNYRTGPNPDTGKARDPGQFAPRVSLADLLTNQVPRQWVEDRIVLIGYSDLADRNADYWQTPYGEVPGVILQGQMASQLISRVLDNRPLIRWWPLGAEVLWIAAWAMVGGLIFWRIVRSRRLIVAIVVSLGLLYGTAYILMVSSALWIPLVPPLITFLLTATGVAVLNHRLRNP
ncbi:histidine kinase [Halomicronema hongdechloris C2206]|uniref:Histidine kinase n=1 Tax=Halomicronema hongdechloris C2206 TaxID=1641165 RepID=A0A1Z3HUQ5_9CYAN|nr:TIR domain-containing protein [Halomicronema hongdechloris]ASC74051.1 histidine kinase [Halomicronema hongdechloris C2206]